MTISERIQSVEDGLTLNGNYEDELLELIGIENDLSVYRHLGTPVWKIQEAREKISAIRAWINEERMSEEKKGS